MKTRLEFIVWCLMDEMHDYHFRRRFTKKERAIVEEANRLLQGKHRLLPGLISKLEFIWRKDHYTKIDAEEDDIETK